MKSFRFLFFYTLLRAALPVLFLCVLSFLSSEVAAQSSKSSKTLLTELSQLADKDTAKLRVLDLLALSYLQRDVDSASVFALQLHALAQKLESAKYMIRGLARLGDIAYERSDFEQATAYFTEALHFSNIHGETRDEPYLLRWMSSVARKKGEFAKGLEYCLKAEAAAIANKDTAEVAEVYNNFGMIYHNLGNYERASEYYFKSVKIWENQDDEHGLVNPINNLGMLFIHQREYRQALEYLKKAADIYAKLEYNQNVGNTIINMGIAYNNLGEYDSAIAYFRNALPIYEKAGNKDRIAVIYLNIGYCHLDQQMYDSALRYHKKALAIRKSIGNEFGLASNLNALCECYLKMKRYEDAIYHGEEAFDKAANINAIGHIRTATGLLAEAYEAIRQYDRAYHFMKLNKAYSDSSFNEQKTRLINDLRIDYEVDKKEQEIEWLNATRELQAAELRQQKLVRNISVAAVVLLVALGIILFRIYRLNREKKELIVKARLEKEKQEAERLKELDEAKSRFFANIAHEFRTPLTLILGPSEQILEEYPDARLKESLGLIRKNAGNLLELTNQMLDLSKLESGMIRLRPERKDFIRFAKGCVFAFASLAEENDIQLRFETDLTNPVVDFDPDKCSIIFNNLLSNALKFTPPFGEVVITVRQFPGAVPSMVKITVADTGIGIPQEQVPYIFDRFYQVDDSYTRKTQGTGIGLALTKELIELHGGEIEVSSTPGKGTSFTFTLPIHHEDAEELCLESSTDTPGKTSTDTEWIENQTASHSLTPASTQHSRENLLEHTVLIVEDNAEVRKFIVDVIGNFYHTLEAENGQVGFDTACEYVPDLIISDVMMPEMDGYTFCKQIRENEGTSHIPLIMLTAKAGIDSKIEGLDRGADDYLAKPFNARELLARIKNLIELRQRLQLKYKQTNDASLFAEKENAFITKLKSVIEENLDREDFSIEDLGQALAMSRTQVHRKLKALTNQSTSQFIRRFKLSKALEMLKTRNYNVSEVAYKVGFNSATYFSTCFAEEFGYAPSELKL